MSVITVENLRYRYPHTKELALDGLDFSVEKGEFIGIIGENGAGKSTLSQAIMGLVPQFYKGAYGGMVTVDGIEAGRLRWHSCAAMWDWYSRTHLTSFPAQRITYTRKWHLACRIWVCRQKK